LIEHVKTFDENHMRDFMDIYIREMKQDKTGYFTGFSQQTNFKIIYYYIISEEQLISICFDLFLAGTETSASTIGFALRYLIKDPRIQDKMREELHRVIGKDRLPTTEDIPK